MDTSSPCTSNDFDEKLLDKQNMYFVGPPLNIKDGDGMIVRPAVLVF
jgi:kynurenine formamidase